MTNSVAVPMIEYHVETYCGRFFSWSAEDSQHLIDDFTSKTKLSIKTAEPYKLWEARQSIKEVAKAS